MEARSNQTWLVELANGHRVVAFLAAALRRQGVPPEVGEPVTLEMSPYDMSRGRIIAIPN